MTLDQLARQDQLRQSQRQNAKARRQRQLRRRTEEKTR